MMKPKGDLCIFHEKIEGKISGITLQYSNVYSSIEYTPCSNMDFM